MRRGDDLGELGQRPLCRRLLLEDVQSGARDDAAVQRTLECRLVDEVAASRIDDSNPRLHSREPRVVEQVPSLRRRRQMQRQVVRGQTEIVEREEVDTKALGYF